MTDPSGSQELQIKKSKDTYYGKSTALEGVYKLNADIAQSLDKSVDDFRNRKLFDFGFSDPTKVEIHSGTKSYDLTRTQHDWWSNGKKMEVDTVAPVLSDLRDLAADKFVDSGFTNPTIDLAVTSEDGKHTEKVVIAKSGNDYIAQRENDPTLYHVASSSIDDLLKTAENLKPASAPTK